MADDQGQKTDSTQANIDELVKELSRTQTPPPAPAPSTSAPKPVPAPVSAQPVPPRPVAPSTSVPPKPPVNPPAPTATPAPAAPKEYQSNIRTMADDLSKLKSGQQPQGTSIPRTVEPAKPVPPATKPAPAPMPAPAPVRPVMPSPTVNKPMQPAMPSRPVPPTNPTPTPAPVPATVPKPVMPSPKPAAPPAPVQPSAPGKAPAPGQFYTPETSPSSGSGVGKNIIFVSIAAAVVILGVVYWYFMIRQPAEVAVETPVATLTPVPTATPVVDVLATLFPTKAGTIVLPAAGDPVNAFSAAVSAQTVSPGQLATLTVTNTVASGSGQLLGVFDLLDRFLIAYPSNLKQAGQRSVVLVYGQQEAFGLKGQTISGTSSRRVVLVSEIASSSASLLSSWEPTMTAGLSGLLGFDKTKNAKGFLENTYQGVSIRFKNFPYPDHSIDYAIISGGTKSYLVIAGSREAMFAAVSDFVTLGK